MMASAMLITRSEWSRTLSSKTKHTFKIYILRGMTTRHTLPYIHLYSVNHSAFNLKTSFLRPTLVQESICHVEGW